MDRDERRALREGIAEDKGLALYREYTEADAAGFLEMHPRTLADLRRQERIFFIRKGPRHIRYLGMHIADFIIASIVGGEAHPDPPNEPSPKPAAKTEKTDRVSAFDLAQRTFGKPRQQ